MKTSKAHLDYWKGALRKQKLPPTEWETSGKTKNWEVYIQRRGRREWFNLGTPNKEAAAVLAREVYQVLCGAGWDVALEKFKPEMVRKISIPTVGDFLAAVEKHAVLKTGTFQIYAGKLRSLVASIIGEDENPARFDQIKGGGKQWRAKVEQTNLSRITIAAVQLWKKKCLLKAGDSPVAQARTRRTINSTLRSAKSLFSNQILKCLPFTLPSPRPLEDVDFEKVSKPRYHSRVDIAALLKDAQNELSASDIEAYKIFILALHLGLRRKEIDGLLWAQFDFERCKLSVQTTEYTELKTAESDQQIDVHPALASELRGYKEKSFSKFVVTALELKSPCLPGQYRCDEHFARLIHWLRGKGVQDDKPLHMLRKEFGSVIAANHGIFAASTALRHSSIAVTTDYYVGMKTPVYFSVGEATKSA